MNQRTQQVVFKRELDRVIRRAVDELELSYYSTIGVLDVCKAEMLESLFYEIEAQQQDTDTDD